jgi:hypothetical protein
LLLLLLLLGLSLLLLLLAASQHGRATQAIVTQCSSSGYQGYCLQALHCCESAGTEHECQNRCCFSSNGSMLGSREQYKSTAGSNTWNHMQRA